MLSKLVSNLANRECPNLLVHEVLDTLDPVLERVIDRVMQARSHRKPCRDAEEGEPDGKDREIPGGEAKADRGALHGPSRTQNPMPRTVWMSFRSAPASTLERSSLIKASSVLFPMSRS